MGCFDAPKVNKTVAIILLIVNIFFPGLGTIIGGIANEGGCEGSIVCAGVLQLIFCELVIPWIWSIIEGIQMVKRAN